MLEAALFAALSLAAPAPQATQPTTPAGCLKAARDFTTARQRAAERITAELYRQIQDEKTEMARKCAAQFDLAKAPEKDLADLVALYGEASMAEQAKATLDRALAARSLTPDQRGDVLLQAVLAGLREPKSPQRNARLEEYVEELDRLPASVFDQQFNAHARLGGYYRGDDIDAGIIKHSVWMIQASRNFTPEQRKQYGATVVSAHINMAEAWAGQGMNDQALALLHEAKRDWEDYPRIDMMVDRVIARYSLVGQPAAPIEAPRWLNAPAGITKMEMGGAVTLLEFTAHWCGPCKESYPGIKRLLARYADHGFRVVLATELYGYFESERDLSTEEEVARDRAYFAGLGLNVPIAIAGQRPTPVQGTDGNYIITPGPNQERYQVGGIPQINIIDRQGRIRLVMVGYDEANEEQLASFIESLLAEH